MNYANQKRIYIDKKEVSKIYNEKNEKQFLHSLSVTKELNGNELKVWLYCMKWTGEDTFYFSPAALLNDFGISESTAQRGFKRLEALGYLTKNSTQGYDFHPCGRH